MNKAADAEFNTLPVSLLKTTAAHLQHQLKSTLCSSYSSVWRWEGLASLHLCSPCTDWLVLRKHKKHNTRRKPNVLSITEKGKEISIIHNKISLHNIKRSVCEDLKALQVFARKVECHEFLPDQWRSYGSWFPIRLV